MSKYKVGEYDRKVKFMIDFDLWESVLAVCFSTIFILCIGDPDIIDAIVCWLMDTC